MESFDELSVSTADALAVLAASSASVATAQAAAAKTATALRKALKNCISGFDELHILTQDTAAAQKATSARKGSSSSRSGTGKTSKKSEPSVPHEPREDKTLTKPDWMYLDELPKRSAQAAQDAAAAFQPLSDALTHCWEGLQTGFDAVWTLVSPEVLTAATTLWESLKSLWGTFYDGVLAPVVKEISGGITWLWDNHLSVLWQNLLELCAAVGTALMGLWNDWIYPAVQQIANVAAPVVTAVITTISNLVGSVAGIISDVISGILQTLTGLVTFVTGVFQGDWQKAWQGVCDIFTGVWNALTGVFKGIINAIISVINGAIRGISGAMNAVVGAVNRIHVTIPKWVPGLGGREVGFSLGTVPSPQIPMLAKGAVIPPNAAFLAVLGDQMHGRNLEAPESLLRKIVREESAALSPQLHLDTPVQVSLDGDVLYSAMQRVRLRRGAQIGGAFADVI